MVRTNFPFIDDDFLQKKSQPERTQIAMNLIKQNKICRKKAWILTSLSYYKYLLELKRNHIVFDLPDEDWDDSLKTALDIDLKPFLKVKNG